MVPRLSQLGIPLMYTKRIFVTSAAINLIYKHNIIILLLRIIYFIVAYSKYDVCTQQLCVNLLMACAVLLHCLLVESTSMCSISFIWIWSFEKGVRQIKGLNLFTLYFKTIPIILALLQDMLGVEWWYCVKKNLVGRCDKAIPTWVWPILLHWLCVEATHIVV